MAANEPGHDGRTTTWRETARLHSPLGLLAELTHRCPLGCPYCSNPLALDPRTDELDTANLGARVQRSRRHSACCRCISPAASRARGATSSRSRPRRMRPASTPISSPRRSASPRTRCASSPKPASITCRSRSRTASPRAPITSPAIDGAFARKRALAAEVVRLKMPLTVNAVMHRANIDRIEDMVALALALGASRVEIAHAQYYGWALKNRAALMPTAEQVKRAAAAVEELRQRASRRDRHRRRRARLLRAAAEALRRRLGPPLAQRDAERARCCRATPPNPFPASNSGRCASMRSPTSGRIRRHSTPSAAPPGCRSRALSCARREIDFGGCRCQAFALTGDARATDPVCHLAPGHEEVAALAAVRDDAPYAYRQM